MNPLCVLLAFFVSLVNFAEAAPLRVMTFNTMCDLCGKPKENGRFKDRLDALADTIARHDPDLLSLQEIRTKRQVKRLLNRLPARYDVVFARGAIFSYTDATLLMKQERFKLLRKGGFWLGPAEKGFSAGWRFAIPRRIEWAELEDRRSGERFRFVGTHFDNHGINKDASAALVAKWIGANAMPTIFAGDTNLKPESDGYGILRATFRDTFDESPGPVFYSSRPTNENSDGCNLSKASSFPDCRIDHVLLSGNAPWRVRSWGVDTEKYFGSLGFVSDHRAVIVDLE